MEDQPTHQSLFAPNTFNPSSARVYLTFKELSRLTGLSLSTLRRRVREGAIPFFQPGGPRSRIVFAADVVDRLLRGESDADTLAKERVADSATITTRGPKPRWLTHVEPGKLTRTGE